VKIIVAKIGIVLEFQQNVMKISVL